MKASIMRASANRQLLDSTIRGGSSGHAQAATTIMRQQKMAARANMPTLSESFTEGARAEEAIAVRKMKSQVKSASGYVPKYNKKSAQVKAQALIASKITGSTAYTMQPVLSAGDKYRLARQSGEAPNVIPAIDGVQHVNTAAVSSTANKASDSAGASMPMLTLMLGLGVGAAYCTLSYDTTTQLGAIFGVSTASNSPFMVGSTLTPTEEATVISSNDAISMKKQPIWLQRQR